MDAEHVVGPGDVGQRLDVFLVGRIGGSRAQIQRLVELGDVQVNGAIARASHKLRAGDRVSIAESEVEPADVPLAPESMTLAVLFEDAALIVISKPAKLVVHPAGPITTGTLANGLFGRWGTEPHLVHRLDRDTSGVMVIARTEGARDQLIAQFAARSTTKHYVALVHGEPAASGRIDAAIRRDKKHRLKMVTCADDDGRDALTLYTVRSRWPGFALLDVEIKTGRTHQIRVHCAHLGHPVVADEMYGKGRPMIAGLDRQFLHAAELTFDHPTTHERLAFTAPLDEDLVAALATLGPPR